MAVRILELDETDVRVFNPFQPNPWSPDSGDPVTTWTYPSGQQWTNSGAGRFVLVGARSGFTGTYGPSSVSWTVSIAVSGADHPDCSALEASEFFGANAVLKNCVCTEPVQRLAADPVNTESGNLHMPVPGLAVSGRGPGLGWSLGYNSLAAGADVGVGSGWSGSYLMRLVEEA